MNSQQVLEQLMLFFQSKYPNLSKEQVDKIFVQRLTELLTSCDSLLYESLEQASQQQAQGGAADEH